jgi:hypothetical protein
VSESFDAWWLPAGIEDVGYRSLDVGELECRYPVPTPALIERTVRSLRAAGRALAHRPVESIVDAVDAAARRLQDPDDPLRQQADRLVSAATGYSAEMTGLVLDRMSADWRAGPTRRLIRAELGDPGVLDGFTRVADREILALGPTLAFHVFAGNVPGVAVTSLIRSLLVKAPALGKLASGQPVLPILFARAIDSVDPELARAMALTYWPGGSEDAEWRVLQSADLVVVYGGTEAVASFRERALPHERLVVHGPKVSAGLIAREALADEDLPDAVARAVAAFDQHGCVSPHTLWVEDPGGHDSVLFARALADAFRDLETELPRGTISPRDASAIHQQRGAAEMRGHDGSVRVFAPEGTAWTVVYDEEPAFRASCLNRFVHVHPVGALEEAGDLLAPARGNLQSIAIAASPARRRDLAAGLARIGATRITTFQKIPWPAPEWHHDGRGPLRELIRWVDLED